MNNVKTKQLMAMPLYCFLFVVTVLLLGIIVGSFFDYDINVILENKTKLGTFFATYGSYFSFCLYPAAGVCLYKGLKKKNMILLGKVMLSVCYFLAVYYSNSYNGAKVRLMFGYVAGESAAILSVLCWMFWFILYLWVPFVFLKIVDDKDAEKLIAVGATIIIAGILADNVNLWLKQVASRPSVLTRRHLYI